MFSFLFLNAICVCRLHFGYVSLPTQPPSFAPPLLAPVNLGSFNAHRTEGGGVHLVYGFYANHCPVNLKCLMHNYEADRGAQELELANTTAAQNWILSLPIYL